MALDATVAGTNADSYITAAEADTFAIADTGPEVTAWQAATLDQKERALKRATREIDAYLRSGWLRYVATQALLFPRSVDHTGTPAVVRIPRSVKLATYEQATYVHKNASVIDAAAVRRARGFQSVSEPNISYSQAPGTEEANVLSPAALLYLEGYRLAGGSRSVRSVRISSGYAA